MPNVSEDVLKALNAALADDAARRARIVACRAIAGALKSIATWLTIDAVLSHEKSRIGLGLVTELGAELATATISLYDVGAYYAGAVLVRQLIEVQYLVAWFAGDPDRPAEWLSTRPADAWRTFRPQKMRNVLRNDNRHFRAHEYSVHSELGGHPNPKAGALVVGYHDPNESLLLAESQWLDLAQHLEPLWNDELVCLARLENFERVHSAKSATEAVSEALGRWHDADSLASRFDPMFIDRLLEGDGSGGPDVGSAPPEAVTLERAHSFATEAMFTVALQLGRLASDEPEDERFVMRRWADWQFVIVALYRLQRAAELAATAPSVGGRVRSALVRFRHELPELKTMRDVAEHFDDYAVDNPARHHKTINRRQLQVGWFSEETFAWLGTLDATRVRAAAEGLYFAVQDAHKSLPGPSPI